MKRLIFMTVLAGAVLSVVMPSEVAATSHGKDAAKETVLIGGPNSGAGYA
jgi:hypothetical protein